MQFDAEIDEHYEADTTCDGVDTSAHSDGVIDAVRKDGHEEHEACIAFGAVHEVVERIIITHENSEGIVSGYSEQSAHDSGGEPVLTRHEDIAYVLNGCKAKADEDGIDDTIEMLIEHFILAQQEP